jgi:uncharacterized protein (TIGR03435 family)
MLSDDLALFIESPIVDATGLNGMHDLNLYCVPNPQRDGAVPCVFDAVHNQPGLRLVASKMKTPAVAVDHADQIPTCHSQGLRYL